MTLPRALRWIRRGGDWLARLIGDLHAAVGVEGWETQLARTDLYPTVAKTVPPSELKLADDSFEEPVFTLARRTIEELVTKSQSQGMQVSTFKLADPAGRSAASVMLVVTVQWEPPQLDRNGP